MRHFEKKHAKLFSPEGPREDVSPGPPEALDGPATVPPAYIQILTTPLTPIEIFQVFLHTI